tara:strand:+ start:6126 stop:6536 length:411 start_codon:yes stop_codon:yes gene_type:complete
MAKFKQLDVLKLEDEESENDGVETSTGSNSGGCFDEGGEEINIGSNTAVGPNGGAASRMGYCLNQGYQWVGLQSTNFSDTTAVTVDLEKIVSYQAFLSPDDGTEDTTKTELTMESQKSYVVNESLANFMKLMATSV